jgi:hypothetical protein
VDVRVKVGTIRLLFDILIHRKPVFLFSLLRPHSSGRSLRSDFGFLLSVPRCHRRAGDRSFRVNAPRLWNSLPLATKQIVKRELFLAQCAAFFVFCVMCFCFICMRLCCS